VEDLDGYFGYEDLDAGTYRIEVSSEGAASALVEVAVENGAESFVEVFLDKPATIRGTVYLNVEDQPLVGARVAIVASRASGTAGTAGEAFGNFMEDRMKDKATSSGGDGSFVLTGIAAGSHTIEGTHPLYVAGKAEITVEAGGEATCQIILRDGYSLSGRIVDHEGVPEPQRPILLEGASGTPKNARSDGDGNFAFNGLKAGKYRLWCATPDLSSELPPKSVEVAGDVTGIEIMLPPPQAPPPPEEAAGEGQPPVPPAGTPPSGLPDALRERMKKQ
jgi:hypothetical protein